MKDEPERPLEDRIAFAVLRFGVFVVLPAMCLLPAFISWFDQRGFWYVR